MNDNEPTVELFEYQKQIIRDATNKKKTVILVADESSVLSNIVCPIRYWINRKITTPSPNDLRQTKL